MRYLLIAVSVFIMGAMLMVSLHAGAEETGKTLDMRIKMYELDSNGDIAREIVIALLNDNRLEDAIAFGKEAYERTPHGALAREVVITLLRDNQLEEAVSFGKDAYEQTPHGELARAVVIALLKEKSLEDAAAFGQEVYEQTPIGGLAREVVITLMRDNRPEDAAAFGTEAYERTPHRGLAREVVIALVRTGQEVLPSGFALAYAKNAPKMLLEDLKSGAAEVTSETFVSLARSLEPDTGKLVADLISAAAGVDDPEPAYRMVVRHNFNALVDEYPDAETFQKRMRETVVPLLNRCSDGFRLETYQHILSIIPLGSAFAEWEDVMKEYSWRVDQLKDRSSR